MHRKFCFLVCLLLLPFLLVSCGERQDFLECLDGDFVCLVRGEVGGEPFAATVDGDGRVIYSSPERLRAIIAAADGETLTLGDMDLQAPSLVGLFLPARLLCDGYEVTGSGAEQDGGCFVDGTSEHGSRRVYVASNGTPCRVVGEWRGIHADFEITDFQTVPKPK